MPFLIHLTLWTAAITPLLANPLLIRETGPLIPEEELQGFTVPDGFEVQLFAAEPMINKPINLALGVFHRGVSLRRFEGPLA